MVSTPSTVAAPQVLLAQMKMTFDILDTTLSDCTEEIANVWREGWTTQPISALYAHALTSVDWVVNETTAGGRTVYERDGWGPRLGIDDVQRFLSSAAPGSLSFNLGLLREYGAAVRASVEGFLSTASEGAMTRQVDSFLGGKVSGAEFVAVFGVMHLIEHFGEISALKGVLGLKGLPF
jgi:hypothetical protein